jgi:hypothetical protein
MAEISGENLVPSGGGRAGIGAAYVLGNRTPDALSILLQGDRTRALAARRAEAARQKQAEQIGKNFADDLKYNTKTGRLFQDSFDEQAAGLSDKLTAIYKQQNRGTGAGGLDSFEVARQSKNLLNDIDRLRVQGEEKQKFWDTMAGRIAHDPTRNTTAYNTALAKYLLTPEGKRVLAVDHDPEATAAALDADPMTYNEGEVVRKSLHDLVPIITQRVADAGILGGQHRAEQVRGQLLSMENGEAVLNADGTPKLNFDGGVAEMLDQGAVKVLADAREAAYNKRREADPSLPAISRRGHLAMMYGPQVAYSQQHTEGLNGQLPRPRTAKAADPHEVLATPTIKGQTSYYHLPGASAASPNHYAAVGQSFGSATKPYVEVEANNAGMQIVGQNGEVTRLNSPAANGRVPMRLASRDYVLYINGKRMGRPEAFQTDEEARQQLLKFIQESPHPEKMELRLEGRGVVVDKARTAGDGLGGAPQPIGLTAKHKPVYDTSTSETQYNVIVPITQDMDAQLQRATKGKWQHHKASAQENELIKAVRARGGRIITPYNGAQPLPTTPERPTTKATRPAWMQSKGNPKQSTRTTKNTTPAPASSGDMF